VQVPIDVLLVTWVNHHLRNAGKSVQINDFGRSLWNVTALSVLLDQLFPTAGFEEQVSLWSPFSELDKSCFSFGRTSFVCDLSICADRGDSAVRYRGPLCKARQTSARTSIRWT
jgi:hypothetical protein